MVWMKWGEKIETKDEAGYEAESEAEKNEIDRNRKPTKKFLGSKRKQWISNRKLGRFRLHLFKDYCYQTAWTSEDFKSQNYPIHL